MKLKYDIPARKRIVADMWRKGYTKVEIANEIGYTSIGHVTSLLNKLGLRGEEMMIDVPKVLALQRAGWTLDQILDEFDGDFTAEQVNTAVRKWKEKRNERTTQARQSISLHAGEARESGVHEADGKDISRVTHTETGSRCRH